MQQPDATEHEVTLQSLSEAIGVLSAALRDQAVPQLWSIEDIATWMILSKSAVYKVVRQPGFPLPLRPSAQPRWFTEEVIEWARKHRDAPANGDPSSGGMRDHG